MNTLPVPGHLIEMGGYCLHLRAMGNQGPAVVLEAGAGGFSPVWGLVQPEVAKFARVYSYDRAGYGWSDPAPVSKPRTAQQAALELHNLLIHAGIVPPYILVGHSYGGFIVRRYASLFPEQVSGLVLVDADSEAEWTERFPPEHRKGLAMITGMMRFLHSLSRFEIPGQLARLGLIPLGSIQKLPGEARRAIQQLGYGRNSLAAAYQDFENLDESAAQMEGLNALGNLPLVVIRHGIPGPTAPGVSPQVAQQIEQTMAEVQAEMTALSSRGSLLVAENSGHEIPIDQPEIVVQAIQKVIELVRA